ncbi:MAG: fgam synth ii: phosphoribosylformylglycinamidine synthase ii [Verrucomicrobiales bacterium]|nr:fgam synth ii: phosphoribosylformylglycinamidine synthase ii [Verrucomicrobiales bacterium]
MASAASDSPTFRTIPILALPTAELEALSKAMKLSLSADDMEAVRAYYKETGREPTDVELEVIAQTWSEHCKHRIFSAKIEHTRDGKTETVDGVFKTYIRKISEDIMASKPGFVLSAFTDNAGFIEVDPGLAVCLKVETHNHPSAIEPYAGANTGLGGVIRDILGAGKGAKPVASLDVFCFGRPDTKPEQIRAKDVIHPLGVMRGVVRGVRDYGNRMGIPTVGGAIQFDDTFCYNPLVFCGTAGVIPSDDIAKEVTPGHLIIAVGGRTGRDGLKGATFSSAALGTESHEEDQSAVQIGNPIEEKKVGDFVLAARAAGLIGSITDCGAGGFSSAAGEMLSETGGHIDLDKAPLKEPGMLSWQIFLSESQERMVLSSDPANLPALQKLADIYETELAVLGSSDGTGILKITHGGNMVCELDCRRLHEAPRLNLKGVYNSPVWATLPALDSTSLASDLKNVLADFAIVSREPVIREYDHEVQGNTVLKPLAGATGDAPQDGSVIRLDGSSRLLALGLSLLPEWGKTDPYAMGLACMDECMRSLVLCGANPDKIAVLDNYCMGNPHDPAELGGLVESARALAEAAVAYGTPFVSGKDSFYNYFQTEDGPVSIPVTALISGMGIVEDAAHVTGASLRSDESLLVLIGTTTDDLGGSVFARRKNLGNLRVPRFSPTDAMALYRSAHHAIKDGLILSAHDVSEGGLAVTLAEMAFSLKAGIEADLPAGQPAAVQLFSETPARFVLEIAPADLESLQEIFAGQPLTVLGSTTPAHRRLVLTQGTQALLDEPIADLKSIWKSGLAAWY